MKSTGRFITIEGIEGVGKSTASQYIANFLSAHMQEVVVTREPGGTKLAESIRQITLTPSEEEVAPDTELLLLFASRAQHLAQVIRPALAGGQWVVCDRFTDSSFAYQGAGRGLATAHIETLANLVHGDLQPDCTLLLDAPVAVGMERASSRSEPDRIEKEQQAFFERVRECFLERAAADTQRFRVIDTNCDISLVEQQLQQVLTELVNV